MPSLGSVKNMVLGSGKLEKACFIVYKKAGKSYAVEGKVPVQFNPSEYSIRRGAKISEKRALGRDIKPSEVQVVRGELSILSLSLYFDSYSELLAGQGLVNSAVSALKSKMNKSGRFPAFDMNEETRPDPNFKVNQTFDFLLSLIRYTHEEHEPPQVGFVWGNHLHFVGKINTYDVQYTEFNRDGTPVRAKLSIQITGEELTLTLEGSEYPFESPDRTKQRTLGYGDPLWLLAQQEYGAPERWKDIAAANGILNPRLIRGGARLKVPSIR